MRALALIATLLAATTARAQSAEDLVRAAASRVLAQTPDLGSVRWGRGIELTDVKLLDADGKVAVWLARVRVQLEPAALYGAGTIEAVEIEGLAVNLRRQPDGQLGIGRILREGGSGGGGGDLAIKRVQIHGPVVVAMPGRPITTLSMEAAANLVRSGGRTRIGLSALRLTGERWSVEGKGVLGNEGVSLAGQLSGLVARPLGWDLSYVDEKVRATLTPPHGILEIRWTAKEGWGAAVIKALELGDLVAGSAGTLSRAKLQLTDSSFVLDGEAQAVRRGETAAARVTVYAEGDPTRWAGNGKVHAFGVSSGGRPLGDVEATVGGVLRRREPLAVDGSLDALKLQGRGQTWTLARPARLRWDRALVLDETTLARVGGADELTLAGRIEPRTGRVDVRLTGRRLALRTLAAAFDTGLELPDAEVAAEAHARGTLGAPVIDLVVDGVAPTRVHVKARLAQGRLSGNGELHLGPATAVARFDLPAARSRARLSAHAHVEALPLDWIKPGLAGAGSLDADLSGTRLDPRLAATLHARLDGGGAVEARVRAPLPVGGRALETTPLDGELTVRALQVPGLPLPVVLDGSLRLTGTAVAPALDGQVSAHAPTALGRLEVASTITWRTALEASLQAGLDGASLLTGRGVAALPLAALWRGEIDRDAALTFDGTVDDVDLARLQPLAGTLGGTVTMRSTLAAPRLTAKLMARQLALGGAPLGPAGVDVQLDRDGLKAVLQARPPSGGSLNGDALLRPGRRSLHVRAERLRLAAANAQVRVDALLDADVTVDNGRPGGFVNVSQGTVAWAGEPVEQALVKGHFDDGNLRLDAIQARVGNGRVEASGLLSLDGLRPQALTLALRTHELPLARDNLGLWLDAEASLQLRRLGDGYDGQLQVTRGEAHVVRAGGGRTLQPTGPLADVTVVGARPAGPAPLALPRPTLPLRLRIDVLDGFHLASQELDVTARASLVIDTRSGVTGHAEATHGGHLELFDRRYDVERAAIDFAPGRTPEVDLAVSRELGEVLLTLAVRGPLDAPTVEMVADPPLYDTTQIGGLVAAGDPRAEASTSQISQRMVGVVTGLIAGRLRERVAPALPVDVVKLEPGATAATPSRLEIGKFVLGDRVYVSYTYQFGGLVLPQRRTNAHQAQVQLKLVRRLSLDARYGDAGAGALDFTFTLRR